jgi:hypothetical protein
MKIYVAARFTEKETVNTIYDQLRKAGHEITGDWTLHVNAKPYDQNRDLAGTYALEDAEGVKAADIMLLLSSPEAGTGVSTELGIAIASKELTGHPKIYLIGEYLVANAFYFHPAVEQFDTIEEAIERI